MQKRWVNSLILMISIGLTACDNGVNFTGRSPDQSKAEDPIVPPVIVPPEEPPVEEPTPLNLKSGTCSVDQAEQVLSCLSCQSQPGEEPPPLLSRKGQELLEIMTAGCSVRNASDPAGYIAPSREEILKRLIQCSPTLYPDTNFIGTQKVTIEALLKSKTAQQSAFGNLYYNWASTDFETYFGFEFSEARYTLCRGDATFKPGGIYPKEYYDALYEDKPYTMPPQWKKAQKNRQDLRNCMAQSLKFPDREQTPPQPGKTCRFESAEGEVGSLAIEKAREWQQAGHKVYFEGSNMCGEVGLPESLLDFKGAIKLAIKICDP